MNDSTALQDARLELLRAAARQAREWEHAAEQAMVKARAAGCSLRAIAAAARVPHTTVADTLRRLAE